MILIDKEVYHKLINIKEREECGFATSIVNKINNLFPVKNKSKNKNKFKMGFCSKLKSLLKIYFTNYNLIAIYHVHIHTNKLSSIDIDNMIEGLIYIVVYKENLFLYRLDNNNKDKKILQLKYKVI